MMNKACTMPRRSTYILLTRMVCAAMVALFVAGIVGESKVAHAASTICNVKNFGAVGDGKHKDTVAIQKAIDTCALPPPPSGGTVGIVEVPPGTYLSAPLYLRSKVSLQIDTGATLDASQTLSDYTIPSGVTLHTKVLAFLNGYKINNVAIYGGGVINGEGAAWWTSGKAVDDRPRLIELDYTQGISMNNIQLKNAGSTHLSFFNSVGLYANAVTITAPSNSPDTDGIDVSNSERMIFVQCNVDTGGNNIAIASDSAQSSTPQPGSSSIEALNCQFKHGKGLLIGNGITGGVTNITVSGCKFTDTTNGIRIQSNRSVGGEVSGIHYSGLTMTNVAHPILFSGYSPSIPSSDSPHPITNTTPNYHDITVTSLTATGASDAGTIVGVPEKPLTAITLDNVTITAKTGLVVRNATVTVIPGGTNITVASGKEYILESHGKVLTVGNYEAESPANTLLGGPVFPVVAACSACSGGLKVKNIGHGSTLEFPNVWVGIDGTYTLTIYYVDGDAGRSAQMTINGSDVRTLAFHGTHNGNWNFVQSLTVSVQLTGGANLFWFSNSSAFAAEIDRITVA